MPCFYRDGICDVYTPELTCSCGKCICYDCYNQQNRINRVNLTKENFDRWRKIKFVCEECKQTNELESELSKLKYEKTKQTKELNSENDKLNEKIKDLENDNVRMRKVLLKTYLTLQNHF